MVILRKEKDLFLNNVISLPGSKSISNRYVILKALADHNIEIENLSNSEDTKVLLRSLSAKENRINIGHAGTAMRFLTAYLAVKNGEFELTGSKRMLQRPIGPLVNAMNDLGADIKYIGAEGYPPIRIKGKKINGGQVSIKSSVSSQFLTALLLIAPFLKEGIIINISGEKVSFSYIDMTLNILEQLGVETEKRANRIRVFPNKISVNKVFVEGDWSAASYWYSLVALSPIGTTLKLKGLNNNSLQGDKAIIVIMGMFGVSTVFEKEGIFISKEKENIKEFEYDFINSPDIAQTVMVAGAALNMKIVFKGLKTLKLKESNRVQAMNTELIKIGYTLIQNGNNWILNGVFRAEGISIDTYDDHRIAMSFAPLIMKLSFIKIKDPEVVNKSYPDFWSDLRSVGVSIK